MSRVEKMQGMLAAGAISTKQGKQFMFSAKKGLKQEVALLTMSAAPQLQVSGKEESDSDIRSSHRGKLHALVIHVHSRFFLSRASMADLKGGGIGRPLCS